MTTDSSDIQINVYNGPPASSKKKTESLPRRKPVIKKVKNKVDLLERPEFTFKWDNSKRTKQNAQVFNVKSDSKNILHFPSSKDINRYMKQTVAGIKPKEKHKINSTDDNVNDMSMNSNVESKGIKPSVLQLENKSNRFKNSAKHIEKSDASDDNLVDFNDISNIKHSNIYKIDVSNVYKTNQQNMRDVSSLFSNNPDIPNIGQRFVKPVVEEIFSGSKFSELPIHPYSVSNLQQNFNITELTSVQKNCIPLILDGNDMLIRSQTGSGKTLAYALPIIDILQSVRPKINRSDGARALIIVPTRELALQTYELLVKLVKPFTWIVPGVLIGGEKRKSEKARLRRGITVLVGTPGRLLDHIQHTTSFQLKGVQYLVLDEADRMLDMGYEKDIRSLIEALKSQKKAATYNPLALLKKSINDTNDTIPKADNNLNLNSDMDLSLCKLQTILLSATLTKSVEQLAGLTLNNPSFVDTSTEKCNKNTKKVTEQNNSVLTEDLMVIPETVSQSYIITPPKLRLVSLSSYIIGKTNKNCKMIIFMATQDMVDFYTELLTTVLVQGDIDHINSDNEEQTDSDEENDNDDNDHIKNKSLINVEFFKLHGSMSQKERTDVFKTFRGAKMGLLLCTDVAARGLDLPLVDCVIQYTGPTSISDYVHRVGRTARAGQRGEAVIFLVPHEVLFVRQLENRRIRLKQENIDLNNVVAALENYTSLESAATSLQQSFESAVISRTNLKNMARKAYLSWIRFYATYPKDIRVYFNMKEVHLGHYAKSFALRDAPRSIGGLGKQMGTEKRFSRKLAFDNTSFPTQKRRLAHGNSNGKLNRSKRTVVSEYSSGLEPSKKKRKKKEM